MATILIIEDDPTLLETIEYNLGRAGYQVITASDGMRGLELARRTRPDLILLDVLLPGIDGFSICRNVAQELGIPIIMVTALRDEAHVITGLELGANDYIVKPFSLGELLARIRATLRWRDRQTTGVTASGGMLRAGPLRLDRSSRRVWYGDREVSLSHKEFDLLACLMGNEGMALSRDLLLERVWGEGFLGSHRTIDVHIRWLRAKIEPDPSNPVLIQTVRGVGYRFQGSREAPR